MTNCDLDTSVPDWIIEHPETLALFQELGIDYCCGGKSLACACREQGLSLNIVMSKLLSRIEATQSNHQSSPCPPIPPSGKTSMQNVKSGDAIQITLGAALSGSKTTPLLKTAKLELIRLVVSAGKEVPSHKAPGEITVQCWKGESLLRPAARRKNSPLGSWFFFPQVNHTP